MITAEQRKNVLTFLARWATIPPENVAHHLADWQRNCMAVVQTPNCGTIACAGGWMALMPEFQAQGVRPSNCGSPTIAGDSLLAAGIAERFFGDFDLFRARGWVGGEYGTDHEVVQARFERLLTS